MMKRYFILLFVLMGLLVIFGWIVACELDDDTREEDDEQGDGDDDTSPPDDGGDPFHLIHQVEVDEDGQGHDYKADEIPADAFTTEDIDIKPKDDDVDPLEPERVHPMLRDMIEDDPSQVAAVLIVLTDDVTIPRFPDLPDGVTRESQEAESLSEAAEELIDELLAQRRASTESFRDQVETMGVELPVLEQFWLINGFLTEVMLEKVETLLESDQLAYIQPNEENVEPPQDDGIADNDVDDGRSRIASDPYFNLNLTNGYMGLLDTGIRTTHVLFNNPSHVDFIRDCVNGGSHCDDTTAAGWNPNDDCWNHGTSSAAVLVGNNNLGNDYRGVTAITLDSWQIYGHTVDEDGHCNGGYVTNAIVRAFQEAIAVFDRVIVGEIQGGGGENGAISQAADNAFDAGAVVVAANGNFGWDNDANAAIAGSVATPGLAHKVIGVGDYDVRTLDQVNSQGRGPAPDGRYKPDIQTPTHTETAANDNDNALKVFTGTSCATPYAAGAAALMRNWLLQHNTSDPGQVYSRMILSGPQAYPNYSNTSGVDDIAMPLCGHAWWGKVSINQGTVIDIPIDIGAGRHDLEAALWWPEAHDETHDDVDIHLIDPSGVERAKGYSGVSIFERTRVDGNLDEGTWKIRIKGYSVQSGPQTVYWTVDVHGC